jgi:hypothetical protein
MSVFVSRFKSSVETTSGLASPSERLVLGKSLSETQDFAVLRAGFNWSSNAQDTKLWLREDAYVTEKALKAFVDAAQHTDRACAFQATGRVGEFFLDLSLGDNRPLLIWMPNGGEPTEELLENIPFLGIECHPRLIPLPAPDEDLPFDFIELPLTDVIVLPTHHWAQLLWTNLIGLGPYLWRQLVGRNIFTIVWNGILAVLRARSFKFSKLFAALRYREKNCQIHPTAVVEGCWLGEDVSIGANAVVRGSILADGAVVEDLAMVEFSVLGSGAKVQRQGMAKFSVVSADASVGGVVQLGLLGENASLKRGAYLLDLSLGQSTVKVKVGDALVDAPLGILGCFLGASSTVGLGVSVAPGRAVPPNVKLVATDGLLQKIDDSQEGVVVVKGGQMESP